jgi:hypothetical protein
VAFEVPCLTNEKPFHVEIGFNWSKHGLASCENEGSTGGLGTARTPTNTEMRADARSLRSYINAVAPDMGKMDPRKLRCLCLDKLPPRKLK